MKPTQISPNLDQQIISLFAGGLGKRRIGQQLHISEDVVQGRLRALGQKRHRIALPCADELRRLYIDEKFSSVEIAAKFDVHPVSIQKRIRRAQIPRRGVGRTDLPSAKQLLAVWNANYTEEQIADMFNLSVSTLGRMKVRYNLPPKPRRDMSGENSPTWKGGCAEYYGPNWEFNRNAARARDNYLCRRCGVTEEEMGRQCDVHHLKRFQSFNNNYKLANALPNLISLCPDCHTYVENHPEEPLPAQPDPSLRTFRCLKTNRLRSYRINPIEVATAYNANEKLADMMAKFKCSATEIYRALRRAGVKKSRLNNINHHLVSDLMIRGKTREEVAKEAGCSIPHTYKIVPAEQPFCEQSEVVAKIIELGRQGLGTRKVAQLTGAGRTQVKALLRESGIGPALQPPKPKKEHVPDLHPCACGCGEVVDISMRKGVRKTAPHFLHGHHRRGVPLNANQLAAVSPNTFKPMDPVITVKVMEMLPTTPQRQIAALLGISHGYVSKIYIAQNR